MSLAVVAPSAESFRATTGHRRLDALLRAFERQPLEHGDGLAPGLVGGWWAHSIRWQRHSDYEPGEPPRVAHLVDPEIADAQCGFVAEQLADWLAAHSFRARSSSESPFDRSGDGFDWSSPEAFGYHDRPRRGHPLHHWTEILLRGQVFGVDFTSTQYGYRTWPIVQRLDVDRMRWERDW